MSQEKTPFGGFRSGFITVVGAPNAGKSTLLNRMIGEKISITSRKPQTTRNRVMGVAHRPDAQFVFIDTPGVHAARDELNLRMVDAALSAIHDMDLVLFVADAAEPAPDAETLIETKLAKRRKPVIVAINKIDRLKKEAVANIQNNRLAAGLDFAAVIPVSAKHGHGMEQLEAAMKAALPEGPPYFPEDTLTDMPERFIVAEMIREKVFRHTGQEIPYSAAVTVESFKADPEKDLIRIQATIHLERDSQKGIVIGKRGAKLKEIGTAARADIERLLGSKVFLQLFVRVQKNWSKDPRALRRFGY